MINLLHYHSLYSSDLLSNNDLITFFEHLDFNQILIEIMGTPDFIDEMNPFIEDKQFAVNALSKRLIHVECMLTKEELLERHKLTEYLSFLASINDFVVLVADPVNNLTQKVDVHIESKEKVTGLNLMRLMSMLWNKASSKEAFFFPD
ncbi:hypothetical protein CHCC20333_3340 [Bacillus paralicheniformis]|uniref:hypothetical protein n=1 Tax=Bacillus paralicheniformis TaxID=1648923 RepID=UPI0013840228|nr:hypothetical protein [Bacillus paralicheniformis]TWK88211.1 hypothetical protein CHCC20333_3340 [Bacillus paralicheniformis]